MAIENSMLGAAHAMANPLTAKFGIVHGQAVGAMMPHVIRFNAAVAESEYKDLLGMVGTSGTASGATNLADLVSEWVDRAGLLTRLRDLGVEKGDLSDLAAGAAEQWTAGFNPRKVEVQQFHDLYLSAY